MNWRGKWTGKHGGEGEGNDQRLNEYRVGEGE